MMKQFNSQQIIKRLDEIIIDGKHLIEQLPSQKQDVVSKKKNDQDEPFVDEYLHLKFVTSSLYFINWIVGHENVFYRKFKSLEDGIAKDPVQKKLSILEALHKELTTSWFWSAQGLANAGVFSNMLEEAEHLLQKGFKIPAAVLVGCVLETHVKDLCVKHNIDLNKSNGDPKSSATITQDLVKFNIINSNDAKELTNYQGIRNSAAHGNNDEFTTDQVVLMIQGASFFISRNPI